MATEKTARRDRVIMGLGIVALLLFMANILTMVKQRFFDERPVAETVVVHELRRVPHAPRAPHPPMPPRIEHRIHITTERVAHLEALVAMKARLAEEAARLSSEAAQLAEAGHSDASLELQESVDAVRSQLIDLQRELDQLRDRMPKEDVSVDEFRFSVVTPSVN